MDEIGRLLGKADFSRETDLKDRLLGQLSGDRRAEDRVLPFSRLSGEELRQVSAAGGLADEMPDRRLLMGKLQQELEK